METRVRYGVIGDLEIAETKTIFNGIKFAIEVGEKKVVLESDVTNIIKYLN